MKRASLLAIILTFLTAGCSQFTSSKRDLAPELNLAIPELWASAGSGNQGKMAVGWLAKFEDKEMKALIDEAMQHNHNLRATAANLRSARLGTIIGRANRLPSVSAGLSGSRSSSRSQQADGDLGPWDQSENYNLSLNTSWEVDLWGRLRNLEQASINDYQAALADFRGARLSLAANTARSWIGLIAAGRQVDAAIQTRDSFARNLKITEGNFKAGDPTSTSLDVAFGRNNVASAERSLLARKLGRDNAARSLEILLGRYPGATIQEPGELPAMPADVPSGLPSELLMRRPDLVAAAARVRASAQRTEASRKSLLPSIRLSSGGSTSSPQLLNLIADPRSIGWNVAASLAQSVYRGGTLTAQVKQSYERNQAVIESFADAALRAFREVEAALAADRSLAEQEAYLDTEYREALASERRAERDFNLGLIGTLEQLEAQRRLNGARSSAIGLRNQRLQNRIDLHLALGGDFETQAP
jgi:NodT family efflux transporter outer membrane factor (OMF) lipoprotein